MSRQRIMPVLSLLFACLLGLSAQSQPAALAQVDGCLPVVVVTSRANNGPGTLREALSLVCEGGTITFGFVQPTTIRLTSSHLVADRSLTIDAAGAPGVTVSGSNAVRVLRVNAGAVVTLNNLTLRSGLAVMGGGILNAGTLTLNHVTVSHSAARGATETSRGGGIFNWQGSLTLNDSAVTSNIAAKITIFPDEFGGLGGGIYNLAGTVTLHQSRVGSNIAELGSGGGVYNDGGQVQVSQTTFDDNLAGYAGGGLFNSGAAIVNSSTFSANAALIQGGGVSQASGLLELRNSTLSGNLGDTANSGDLGAGVYAYAGTVTLNNSTVTRNTGVSEGAGIYNETAAITLSNSIIAGNTSNQDCAGALITAGHNLTSSAACPFDEESDILVSSNVVFTQVLSNMLNDNGGSTQTHALLPYSPAINAGGSGSCEAGDQRSVPRPQSFTCDIGAYEVESGADLVLGYAPLAAYAPAGIPLTYTLIITNAGPLNAHHLVLTDTLSADVTFVSANADLGDCGQAGIIVTCTLPLLPADTTTSVEIVVMPPDGPRQIDNAALVMADTADAYLPDNHAGSSSQVCYCTDLALTQTVTPTAPLHGEIITFTVTVVNTTTNEIASRIFLTDTFPASAVLVTFTTSLGACEFLGNRVACSLGTLLPAESAEVSVAVFANETTGLENLVEVTSYEFEYTPENNVSMAAVTVVPVADLGVTKQINPGLVIVNKPYTYTLVLANNGPDVGRPVRMVAVLPDSFDYVPPFTKEARLHFHLDDPPGSTQFQDYSAYSSNLTCSGSNCPQAGVGGRFGAALQFDGSSDYLLGPTGEGLNPGEAFTFAAWIYSPNTNSDRRVGGKAGAGGDNTGYLLGHKSGKLFAEVWDTAGAYYVIQQGNIPNNTWTHVAMTWQTNGDFVAYLNGTEVGRIPTGPFMVGSNSIPFQLGRAPWGSLYWSGKLDEALFFRRALSANEINDLALGLYAAECDLGNDNRVSCELAALSPNESILTAVTAVPSQEGWFNYRADVAAPTADDELLNNTTYLRTRVVASTLITLTMQVRYAMQDGSSGRNWVWLLTDGTFVDNDAGIGTWESLVQPKRLQLLYEPGYSCGALMTGELFADEPYPHVQGVRQCQDGTGLTGVWRGDFVPADDGDAVSNGGSTAIFQNR